MRDPERIQPFLTELGKIWQHNCYDWRFGQVLSNILPNMMAKHGDMFYWEEDKFLEYFKEEFEKEED